MKAFAILLGTAALAALPILPAPQSQLPPANHDESKVPAYTLPDPLLLVDGTRVTDRDTWEKRRRRPQPQALR